MPGTHPAAPSAVNEVRASQLLTATGQGKDQAGADITGAGYIVGYMYAGGAGCTVDVRDGVGSSVIDHLRANAVFPVVYNEPDLWRRFSNGFNVSVAGTLAGLVVHYRLIT